MIPKFRAWLKGNKKMVDVDEIAFRTHWIHVFYELNYYWFKFDDAKLMQSTGLKDKNGKEIFEGDVLEIEDEGEVLGNAKLTWHNEQAVFMIEAISVDDIAPFHEIVSDGSYSYRVVGNVYENPELLEDKE